MQSPCIVDGNIKHIGNQAKITLFTSHCNSIVWNILVHFVNASHIFVIELDQVWLFNLYTLLFSGWIPRSVRNGVNSRCIWAQIYHTIVIIFANNYTVVRIGFEIVVASSLFFQSIVRNQRVFFGSIFTNCSCCFHKFGFQRRYQFYAIEEVIVALVENFFCQG